MILDINKDTEYLQNHIALLVADWPGQLFVRKAITNLHKLDSQYSIPTGINSFIPILGPFHISLNSREYILIIYYTFFQKLFHFVFDIEYRKVIDLLDNIIPATLDMEMS
ncbi:hypothetical protein GLOIN_2v1872628 [Rhizophagus irregularis DAOM 181602=DAOM 197198]|nr:hypothetical protein GLOIN_2v1872628 [Rhizophagus irregularis DAOM 181602=DAOM 197198]